MVDFTRFKAETKKQLELRGWKYADLAKATGYSVNSIESFMCGARAGDKLCKAVSEALSIPEHMTT